MAAAGGGDGAWSKPIALSRAMPRWVKIFAAVTLALVAAAVIAMVAGVGGEHGPGRHFPGIDAGEDVLSEQK